MTSLYPPEPAPTSIDINSIGPTSFNNETLKPIEKFDNKARSGEIGTVKRISREETARLDPFSKIDDHNTVLAIFPIDVSTSDKPDAKIKYKRGYENYSGNEKDRISLQDQGYLSNFRFEKVPAGSTVLSPVDGQLFLFRENAATNDHPFSHAIIEFKPREGEIFVMTIDGGSTSGGRGMMNPSRSDVFRSLTNAPAYDQITMSPSILEVIEQAIPVKKGQPIMQTATEINVGFDITFSARPNTDSSKLKKVGETIENGEKRDVFQVPSTHLKLHLSEDGEIVQPQLPNN